MNLDLKVFFLKFFSFLILLIVALEISAQNLPYQPNGEIDSLKLAGGIFLHHTNSKTGNPRSKAKYRCKILFDKFAALKFNRI